MSLRLEHVTYTYSPGSVYETHALKDVSLEIPSVNASRKELEKLIGQVQKQMQTAAADLNFEMAAQLRDKMIELKDRKSVV